jgi:hypothetical protein
LEALVTPSLTCALSLRVVVVVLGLVCAFVLRRFVVVVLGVVAMCGLNPSGSRFS